MNLFYAPDITAPEYKLDGQEGRHAVKVLRLGPGDPVALTDGRGGMYEGEVVAVDGTGCRIRVVSKEEAFGTRPYGLTMAVAPTKNGDRFEWFLEKATEIGCDRFIPLICEHSERKVFRPDRAERIITSAMKQSFSAWLPALEGPVAFRDLVSREIPGDKFIAHCGVEQEKIHLSDTVVRGADNLILIGPEGDFSPSEIGFAVANGFRPVSLGTRRLRTETARVVAGAIVAMVNR